MPSRVAVAGRPRKTEQGEVKTQETEKTKGKKQRGGGGGRRKKTRQKVKKNKTWKKGIQEQRRRKVAGKGKKEKKTGNGMLFLILHWVPAALPGPQTWIAAGPAVP